MNLENNMKARFKIEMVDAERSIRIAVKYKPVHIEEMIEVLKALLLAWGYTEQTVNTYLDPEDMIVELQEEIESLKDQLKKKDAAVFSIK